MTTVNDVTKEVVDALFLLSKEAFKTDDGSITVEDFEFTDKETGRKFILNVTVTED